MSNWELDDPRYNAPMFERDYPAKHGNPNYHYGYTSLPSYDKMPLASYEQNARYEQQGIPAHLVCDCGCKIALKVNAYCDKCGKDWSKFVASRDNNPVIEAKAQILGKEGFLNLPIANTENIYTILLFVFMIFISCIYVHMSSMRREIDILNHKIDIYAAKQGYSV
jgi:hypothetical protein